MIALPCGVFRMLVMGLFGVVVLLTIGNYALCFLHRPTPPDGWELIKMAMTGLLGLLAVPESSMSEGRPAESRPALPPAA